MHKPIGLKYFEDNVCYSKDYPPNIVRCKNSSPGAEVAVYECAALDSPACGNLVFLAVGPAATYREAPESLAGCNIPIGWAFLHIGWLDYETNKLIPERKSK